MKKENPALLAVAKKKFYAIAIHNDELALRDLTDLIEKESTLSRADIHGALISIVNYPSCS